MKIIRQAQLFNACSTEYAFRQCSWFISTIHIEGDSCKREATLESIFAKLCAPWQRHGWVQRSWPRPLWLRLLRLPAFQPFPPALGEQVEATVLPTRCLLRQSLLCWQIGCGISGCCQVSPYGDFNAHSQLQQGGEREGLSQRRVKGSTRVSSFGPGSGRHAGVSIISNVFGVHSHPINGLFSAPSSFGRYPEPPFTSAGLKPCCSMAVTRSGRIWTGR